MTYFSKTYDYLKEPQIDTVGCDVDLADARNMKLMQIGDQVDIYSPLIEDWTFGVVIKAGNDWIECMFGSLAVTLSLADMPVWTSTGFKIRSSTGLS